MTLAVVADDLNSVSIGIGYSGDGPGDLIVEAGPATVALELHLAGIERRVAQATQVETLCFVVGVLSPAGILSALINDNACLLLVQRVIALATNCRRSL